MELIYDRTQADVLMGTKKGSYGPEDLNRVEGAVKVLRDRLEEYGTAVPALETKTNWRFTETFSPEEWPTTQQMERYLDNVRVLLEQYGVAEKLPSSMEELTWEGANQIERGLARMENCMENQKAAWQRCGAAESGG